MLCFLILWLILENQLYQQNDSDARKYFHINNIKCEYKTFSYSLGSLRLILGTVIYTWLLSVWEPDNVDSLPICLLRE